MWDPSQYPAPRRPSASPVPPPGYDPSTSRSATNGFAVAALVLGLLAPCGVGLLSIIFGIIALVQIKKTRQRGKGLAIGGLAATGVWLAAIGVIVAVGLLADRGAERDPSGEIAEGGQVNVNDLTPGDCVNGLSEEETTSLPAVPCAEPHEGEVYALFDVSQDGDWPGEDAIFEEAEDGCLDRLADYSPIAHGDDQVAFFALFPSPATWRIGDREIICIAYFLDGERAGPLPR